MIKKLFHPLAITSIVLFASFIIYFLVSRPKTSIPTAFYLTPPFESICINDTCLQQKDGLWWYGDFFPADINQVDKLGTSLQEIKLDTVISENPAKLASLGFDVNNPLVIRVGDTTFWLSTLTQTSSYSLIKPTNQDKVYKITFIAYPDNLLDPNFWQLQYLSNLSTYQITSIDAKNQRKQATFSSTDTNFPDQSKLDVLAHLKPTSYIGSLKPNSNPNYTYQYDISTDQDTTTLYFGYAQDRTCWSSTDNKNFYQISKSDFDTLTSLLF